MYAMHYRHLIIVCDLMFWPYIPKMENFENLLSKDILEIKIRKSRNHKA